jgi:hypothetical protein
LRCSVCAPVMILKSGHGLPFRERRIGRPVN